MKGQVKTKFVGQFWLIYFILSIGVVGGIFAYGLAIPLHLLGVFFPRLHRAGDVVLQKGVAALMDVQPWFHAVIELHLPPSRAQIPDARPFILISNHRSHLDAFTVLSRVIGIRMLARSSLFKVPFLGVMMFFSGQISAKRGSVESLLAAMETVKKKMLAGDAVLIFPEMTRCEPGFHGVQEFSLLPFQAAKQSDALIVPVVFKGTDQVWPKGGSGISPGKKIFVKSLAPIDARQFQSVTELKDFVRNAIAAELDRVNGVHPEALHS